MVSFNVRETMEKHRFLDIVSCDDRRGEIIFADLLQGTVNGAKDGMLRLGYAEEASRLAAGLIGAVEREGLREYYDPRDGTGLGAEDFAWSALIAELADPDPAAAASYL